ncbi:MAG: energy-coupling factor transporter ATPase [Selenomonadaceae bacterium]|nr:energy-coupling factor transporter ATPase [Selenomonadaceae bacterium]
MKKLIDVKNLTYTYMEKTPFEKTALKNISLSVDEGNFLAIAGHTGSGKSTLIQIIAGLIEIKFGSVEVDGEPVKEKSARRNIGIVFQYPEHQLFEETVEKDIAFGPINFGLSESEVAARVDEALKLVGLGVELKNSSPFELSGGQRRRVAIAGILALKPKYLILDEPTAGLDPRARKKILSEIKNLHKLGVTIILVTHSMEDIAALAGRVIVLADGEILFDGAPRKLFAQEEILKRAGLLTPSTAALAKKISRAGFENFPLSLTIDEVEREILKMLGGKSKRA